MRWQWRSGGGHDLEQAEAASQGLLSKGPCIQESPGGNVLRRYTYVDTKVVTPNRLRPRCFSSTKPQCLHSKSSSKYPVVGKGNCTGYWENSIGHESNSCWSCVMGLLGFNILKFSPNYVWNFPQLKSHSSNKSGSKNWVFDSNWVALHKGNKEAFLSPLVIPGPVWLKAIISPHLPRQGQRGAVWGEERCGHVGLIT